MDTRRTEEFEDERPSLDLPFDSEELLPKISQIIESQIKELWIKHRLIYTLKELMNEKFYETLFGSDDNTINNISMGKFIVSIGFWGGFSILKNKTRDSMIKEQIIQLDLEENPLTVRQALLNILTSFIGQEDLRSFKYKLLNGLFGLTAHTNEQARKVVHYSIAALERPDQYMELGCIARKNNN